MSGAPNTAEFQQADLQMPQDTMTKDTALVKRKLSPIEPALEDATRGTSWKRPSE
ncbi:rCG52087 [Rattus norvegicus]|uniref:RCG52087 n=1 Tax=Rattus norvegicus TaxID=10116 RepID=A6K6H3_RAT|nr:rCG52087 [Rattus norvegicus]